MNNVEVCEPGIQEQVGNKLCLQTISNLLNRNFYVDSYQRGYRWGIRQINDLLDDLNIFFTKDTKKEGEFYCLQPLAVALRQVDKKWELIDGQQRLTTIYLILTYLKTTDDCKAELSVIYSIDYNTRTASRAFLDKLHEINVESKWEDWIEKNIEDDKIDNFHFFQAYQTILKWFNNDKDKKQFLQGLLKLTKVIWFELIDKTEMQIKETFERLNIGKIPLTNAELIKALFLNKDIDILKRNEIAYKWERIEYALQDESFWYFINPSINNTPTRIEFIFDLLSQKFSNNNSKEEKLHTFFYFKDQFDKKIEIAEIWRKVEETYQVLLQWNDDPEHYHYIGYLITTKLETTNNLVSRYIKHPKSKSDFLKQLKSQIYHVLDKYKISGLEYGKSNANDKIINTLLFFNVQTTLEVSPNNRFPFNQYKKITWSLEHIHAQNSKALKDLTAKKKWAVETRPIIELFVVDDERSEDAKQLLVKLDNIISSENDIDVDEISAEVFAIMSDSENNGLDSISNLALLDKDSNSKLNNSLFPVKRGLILELEKELETENMFIPICTKNVFLKYYSKDISQMFFWGKADKDNYLDSIENSINKLK